MLITDYDDGIKQDGVMYLNSSSCFVEEDECNDDPTPAGFIRGYFFGNSFLSNSLVLLISEFAEIILKYKERVKK